MDSFSGLFRAFLPGVLFDDVTQVDFRSNLLLIYEGWGTPLTKAPLALKSLDSSSVLGDKVVEAAVQTILEDVILRGILIG
jgi:hypothetical protein